MHKEPTCDSVSTEGHSAPCRVLMASPLLSGPSPVTTTCFCLLGPSPIAASKVGQGVPTLLVWLPRG